LAFVTHEVMGSACFWLPGSGVKSSLHILKVALTGSLRSSAAFSGVV
jgi:hypothetical protein